MQVFLHASKNVTRLKLFLYVALFSYGVQKSNRTDDEK